MRESYEEKSMMILRTTECDAQSRGLISHDTNECMFLAEKV